MSASTTASTPTALAAQPLPRPRYLQGVTIENTTDRPTRSALHIFENGRLSTTPCYLCFENDADCIVAPALSGRCMRCSYKSKGIKDCMAEGVKANPWSHITFPPQPAGPVLQPMQATTPASSLPIRPSAATPGSTAAMASRPDAQIARQSVFPVNVNTITHVAANPEGNTNHHCAPTTQLKRKRRVSDPADAVEIGAQRIRAHPRATATEHPYAPTSPPSVTEHPYAPTDPTITARASSPISSVAVTTQDTEQEETPQDLSTVRFAPFGSIDYDLAIRTEDRGAWVQWANDLHREIRSLRHVQDVGPYTTAVIAMMIEDGVWPRGDPVDLTEE